MQLSDIVLGKTYISNYGDLNYGWPLFNASFYDNILLATYSDIQCRINHDSPFIVLDKKDIGSSVIILIMCKHGIMSMFYSALDVPIILLCSDAEGAP